MADARLTRLVQEHGNLGGLLRFAELLHTNEAELRSRLARSLRTMKWVNKELPLKKVYETMYQERAEIRARKRGRQ